MRNTLTAVLLFMCLYTFAQKDTLSYKVTSTYNNGNKRTDLIELTDGYIENAFYKDGKHYCWTRKLDANKKVKWLYEFQYVEENNFNSELSIKIHYASYTQTHHFSSGYGLYSNYSTNSITINSSTPTYTHEKTIVVKKDGFVVYRYASGQLWWTYYYDKNGTLQYGINKNDKWIYNVEGDKMIETSPEGEKEEYEIDNNGYGRKRNGEDLISWALSDLGRIQCRLSYPKWEE